MSDPLRAFKEWEGEELGPNKKERPGFRGEFKAPAAICHIAGAWAISTARQDRHGHLHPAVYVRQIIRSKGTDTYHVVDAIVDAEVAMEWAEALRGAAKRAPKDIARGNRASR